MSGFAPHVTPFDPRPTRNCGPTARKGGVVAFEIESSMRAAAYGYLGDYDDGLISCCPACDMLLSGCVCRTTKPSP